MSDKPMFSTSGFVLLMGAAWFIYDSYESTPNINSKRKDPSEVESTVTKVIELSSQDNLGTWRQSPQRARSSLAAKMTKKLKLPLNVSEPLQVCISETATDETLGQQQIAEVAAACITLLGNQMEKDST